MQQTTAKLLIVILLTKTVYSTFFFYLRAFGHCELRLLQQHGQQWVWCRKVRAKERHASLRSRHRLDPSICGFLNLRPRRCAITWGGFLRELRRQIAHSRERTEVQAEALNHLHPFLLTVGKLTSISTRRTVAAPILYFICNPRYSLRSSGSSIPFMKVR